MNSTNRDVGSERSLYFRLNTNKSCNLHCPFCCQKAANVKEQEDESSLDAVIESFKKAEKYIFMEYGKMATQISLIGGEISILKESELQKLASALQNYNVYITTNGTHLDKLKCFDNGKCTFNISLHETECDIEKIIADTSVSHKVYNVLMTNNNVDFVNKIHEKYPDIRISCERNENHEITVDDRYLGLYKSFLPKRYDLIYANSRKPIWCTHRCITIDTDGSYNICTLHKNLTIEEAYSMLYAKEKCESNKCAICCNEITETID